MLNGVFFLRSLANILQHISFKLSAFESHTEHVIAIVQRAKVIGVCTAVNMNLLAPCTAANSIGDYIVGVVDMG